MDEPCDAEVFEELEGGYKAVLLYLKLWCDVPFLSNTSRWKFDILLRKPKFCSRMCPNAVLFMLRW